MSFLSKAKKFLTAAGLVISLFSSVCVPAYAATLPNTVNSSVDYGYEVPDGAIVLGESIQELYFNPETGTQISEPEALRNRSVTFKVTAKHTIFQVPTGRVDLGISVTALDIRARLKGINGWMNVDDLNSHGASSQTIKESTLVPTFHFGSYIEGIKSFARGTTVQVSWNYNVNVIGGSIPSISGNETVDIVR